MASSSQQELAARYWAYLIRADKSPSPVLEQLLLAIGSYIIKQIAPWNVSCLTPEKLAHYYRLVGGDYDSLFLQNPHTSIAFIYRSLGCFHTLQPEKNPYAAPSVPALTPHGFVRWQTVQLLLDPDEHVPFLQVSVKRLGLVNPIDGKSFPCILPRSALPLRPDPDMTAWHASIAEKLMLEAEVCQQRPLPRKSPVPAVSDIDESSRPTSADSLSIESQSRMDAASYFLKPQARVFTPRSASTFAYDSSRGRLPSKRCDGPWSPLQRRSSYPEPRPLGDQRIPPSADRARQSYYTNRPREHVRAPSSVSTTSCSSDCSSSSTNSASPSPVRHNAPSLGSLRLRAGIDSGPGAPLHRPKSHPSVLEHSYSSKPQRSTTSEANRGNPSGRWHNQRYDEASPPVKGGREIANNATHSRYRPVSDKDLNRARSVGARPLNGPKIGPHVNAKCKGEDGVRRAW